MESRYVSCGTGGRRLSDGCKSIEKTLFAQKIWEQWLGHNKEVEKYQHKQISRVRKFTHKEHGENDLLIESVLSNKQKHKRGDIYDGESKCCLRKLEHSGLDKTMAVG